MADLAGGDRQQHLHPPQRTPDATTQVAGSIARAPFIAGEPIREQKLVRADGSGFMAAILPTGMRAISTEISPETGAGGFILPNDRVDVILSKREKNPDSNGPDVVNSEIILTNVRVLAIDQAPKEKDGQNAVVGKTVTLELKPGAGRDAGARAPERHAVAGAAQHRRCQHGREPNRRASSQAWRQRQRRSLRRRQPDDDAEVTERTHEMKCRGNQPVMRTFMVRALSFSAVAALMLNPALTPVVASDYRVAAPVAADGQMNARFLALGIGKSVVIDLPRDIKDVLVADPKIANAVVRSAQRAYIIGAAVGQTNIVFFDSAGQQIAAYDIAVKRDLNGVRAALKQHAAERRHPDRRRRRRRHADRIGGEPGRGAAGRRSRRAAGRRRRQGRQLDRGPRPRPGDAEGHRRRGRSATIIKQLGIDLTANMNYGTAVVNFNNANPFTAYGRAAGRRQRH